MLLFAGIVIGIVVVLLFGAILSHIDLGTELTKHPKTFGDIKVWVQKPLIAEGEQIPEGFYQEVHKMLWMTKDDVPFLIIAQNKEGEISGLYLVRGKNKPILTMNPSNTPGKWVRTTYGNSDGAGSPIGDTFIDIDFNGSFDFKFAMDSTGNLLSRSIFMDGSWEKINQCNLKAKKAAIGQTIYVFDPNLGWQCEE